MTMDHDEIARLTQEYGLDFGVKHTLRLLKLVALIGEGTDYNQEAIWLAAHLHDWGGYQPWLKPGIDHAVRSREVVDQFLSERACPEDLKQLVLDCVVFHHSGDPDRPLESILLSDADALDFLGTVGFARCFAMIGRDLRAGYEYAKKRRDISKQVILLDKSKELARPLLEETDLLLLAFEQETFGLF
jgi:uncharacterized protein